jgi:adenylate kinase family enzyme
MKIFTTYILILVGSTLNGQVKMPFFLADSDYYLQWTFQDFIKYDVKKIEAYSYEFKKNGKKRKDSILLYKQIINRDSNIVKGIFSEINLIPYSRTWYKFEDYYNSDSNFIKRTKEHIGDVYRKEYGNLYKDKIKIETNFEYDDSNRIVKKVKNNIKLSFEIEKRNRFKEYSTIFCDTSTAETIYEYYDSDRLSKKTNNKIRRYYIIYKHLTDTIHKYYSNSFQSKFEEYKYNSNDEKIEWLITLDSIRYNESDTNYIECSGCRAKYKRADWKYNKKGKVINRAIYNNNGDINSNIFFKYSSNSNLIQKRHYKYSLKDTARLDKTVDYYYKNNKLSKSIEKDFVSQNCILDSKLTIKYDEFNREISYESESYSLLDDKTYKWGYSYKYDKKEVLKNKTIYRTNKDSSTINYYYNSNGLPHKYLRKNKNSNKTIEIKKYFYQYNK